MARGHGRILASIWEDSDFLTLTEQQQRLYLFLISQPNLNHAGLLPLTLRRWARKAHGLTAAELEKHLQELADARFIVLDDDTEELLIRSFVRNDGVWKQPKVMGAMVSGAMEISSRLLQRALLAEMDRIPLDDLSDEPTKVRNSEGPSIRRQVADHIEALRQAFGNPNPDPTRGGSATPSETPSAGPSVTPSDTPAEGGREGSTRAGTPTRPRADARSRARAGSPAPAPTPVPSPVEEGGGCGSGDSYAHAHASNTAPEGAAPFDAPIDRDGFTVTDAMRRWAHRDGYADLVDLDYETDQFVSHFRANGSHRPNWPEEWKKWIRRSHKFAVERAQQRSNVIDLTSGQPLPGTDTTVSGWAAVAAQLAAKEDSA